MVFELDFWKIDSISSVSKERGEKGAADVAQWESTCLVCMRPYVRSLSHRKEKRWGVNDCQADMEQLVKGT